MWGLASVRKELIRAGILVAAILAARVIRADGLRAEEFFGSTTQVAVAEAAANGRIDALDRLVASGADLNAIGRDGMTAAYWAVIHRSREGLHYLLQHGADPNVIYTHDGTAATSAAAMLEDSWFLQEVLSHRGDINIRNPVNGRTPLFESVYRDRDDNVRLLIAMGANMNTLDSEGGTPLVTAAANQRYQLVYAMLTAGADPTMATTWGAKSGLGGVTMLTVMRHTAVPTGSQYQWREKVSTLLRAKGLDVEHGR